MWSMGGDAPAGENCWLLGKGMDAREGWAEVWSLTSVTVVREEGEGLGGWI